MVVSIFYNVVTLYIDLFAPVHQHDLDTFTDVVWPATKLRLAATLESKQKGKRAKGKQAKGKQANPTPASEV